jgi:hypothetical protein
MIERVVFAARSATGLACRAHAIDFYKVQIYHIEPLAQGHVQAELHSNSVASTSDT